MTTLSSIRPVAPSAWQARSEAQLVQDQLVAIDAWLASRRALELQETAAAASTVSRETRLDLSRRLDVLRREHEAILSRTQQHLHASVHLMQTRLQPRALIAHRSEWFRGKVVDGLASAGIEVVEVTENGADAVGIAVADQPDLVFVENKLAMINGEQVIRKIVDLCPRTIVAAQVGFDDEIASSLSAGARVAFTRRVPPAEVVEGLRQLVAV